MVPVSVARMCAVWCESEYTEAFTAWNLILATYVTN